MLKTSVEAAGPPPVVACTMSKVFIEPISAVVTLKVSAGASIGQRTDQKVRHGPAPSHFAASSISPGMPLRPAR